MQSSHQGHPRAARDGEELLFLRRWLAHPLKVGALLPSSAWLGRLVARNVTLGPGEYVVEVGAGTGTVTRELLASGIPSDRLFVVELDPDLCAFLRRQLPGANVIQGDATQLRALLPADVPGKVRTVISGIPMVTLPLPLQRRMIDAWFDVMGPGGRMLQYTYSLVSPLPEARLGVRGRRCGIVMRNVPPAWVWSYTRDAEATRAA
ncbi:MAG: class I SAM-dependent methyltransferase [Rhodospirillales bacterium]|jgi:phosphatidylethanolamine/phosphatidyl-N-methylethanolamine N-methyltransferase